MSSNWLIVPWRKENQWQSEDRRYKGARATDNFSPMR
jgi:hypothetical protein